VTRFFGYIPKTSVRYEVTKTLRKPWCLGDFVAKVILFRLKSIFMKKSCNYSVHQREHVVCSHCLRPTLSLNFPQATAAAHMLCR
jgi:hypothetical protein